MKCGWFGGERAHAVVLVETASRLIGATVTIQRPADAWIRSVIQDARRDGTDLAVAHDVLAGDEIRAAVRHALATVQAW